MNFVRIRGVVFVALASLLLLVPAAASAAMSPAAWVAAFWPSAKAAGISRATYDRALKGFAPDPDVMASANAQPEFTWKVWDYVDQLVSDDRIAKGTAVLEQYADVLAKIEARYKVDRRVIVAIWGIESDFGAMLGDPTAKNAIRSLATLAYDGGRFAAYGREQLVAAFGILERGDVSLDAMTGSWAGAMGETQFIPTSYELYAVDFDGDGRRNIWSSVPDALASTANLLAKAGWRFGEAWGYEVTVPARLGNPGERTLASWQSMGVKRIKAQAFPRPSEPASLYRPNDANGPSFLLTRNFGVFKRYNNSNYYALAVAHLADRLGGGGSFVTPWPEHEKPLSEAERQKLQLLLTMQGAYDGAIDGVLGSGSREAIRSFQRSIGLTADGVGTRALLQHLETGS
jgi:membrane-bound lytic murein transglycosylase B